jgi:ABC-2 type transport system permease protein
MKSPVATFARLELAESIRSKWALFAFGLYALMLVGFVWLGLRESTVLGFTGLSRVLLNLSNAVVVVFPLVVLVGTYGAVVGAKTSGFFELMLTQPVRRGQWLKGLILARLTVLAAPLVLILLGCGIVAAVMGGEEGMAQVAARSIAITSALVFGFMGLGLYISTRSKTVQRAMVAALVAWALAAALHDVFIISVLLRTSLPPQVVFFLSALNPSEAARIGLLSSVDPELSVLGPVGFWLANALGPAFTLALAVGWPAAIGALATWRAFRTLERADLVA